MMTTKQILTVFLLLFVMSINANNINVIGEAKITGKNISAGENNYANYAYIDFSISWENSWRTSSAPFNYDAAWVFAKYRIGNGEWKHITVSQSENQSESNTTIEGVSDGKGVFLYRSIDGTGTFTSNNNQLKWNYTTDGVNDSDDIEVKIFAIEMVYVPEGQYYLGTPGFEIGSFYEYPSGADDQYLVSSEDAISIGETNGSLSYKTNYIDGWPDGNAGDRLGPIPSVFPKGFAATYVMKYEITQVQYVDFLNMLTRDQQNFHTASNISGTFPESNRPFVMSKTNTPAFRNGIRVANNFSSSGSLVLFCDLNNNGVANEDDDGQTIACNFISWSDQAAYADWSGLRPMTELEYEKTCRGSEQTPIGWETSWAVDEGLRSNADQATGISNSGSANEEPSNSGARGNYCSLFHFGYGENNGVAKIGGPMRVGCFADASSDRVGAGASYYGVMNMSDNLRERVINIGTPEGRAFTGTNGDGLLDAQGLHTNIDWPSKFAKGSGGRGADWVADVHHNASVSYRYHVCTPNYTRSGNNGMRACRTAE